MEIVNLPIDLLKKIIYILNYNDLLILRLVDKKFNCLLTIEKCKKIYFRQKTGKFFYRWYYSAKAKNQIRRIFIEKLIYDIDFRKKYIYIHEYPSPHICLKFENLGTYFQKIFYSHNFFIKYFQLNYSSTLNSIINMQEDSYNLNDIINEVINNI